MRCADVIRELAVPSDDRDATALAEHLSGCQTCATWAGHATHLEALWESTKPPEPRPATWDAMWTDIVSALDAAPSLPEEVTPADSSIGSIASSTRRFDAAPVDATRKARVQTRSLLVIGLIGLAQAAAILVAVGLAWHQPRFNQNDPPSFEQASNSIVSVEIEEGRTVLIRSQGTDSAVLDLTPDELKFGVDDLYVMFNALESMATNPIVAMKE